MVECGHEPLYDSIQEGVGILDKETVGFLSDIGFKVEVAADKELSKISQIGAALKKERANLTSSYKLTTYVGEDILTTSVDLELLIGDDREYLKNQLISLLLPKLSKSVADKIKKDSLMNPNDNILKYADKLEEAIMVYGKSLLSSDFSMDGLPDITLADLANDFSNSGVLDAVNGFQENKTFSSRLENYLSTKNIENIHGLCTQATKDISELKSTINSDNDVIDVSEINDVNRISNVNDLISYLESEGYTPDILSGEYTTIFTNEKNGTEVGFDYVVSYNNESVLTKKLDGLIKVRMVGYVDEIVGLENVLHTLKKQTNIKT